MIFNLTTGQANALPVLEEAYPQDAAVSYKYGSSASALFEVVFAQHGRPAQYSYQWYLDGTAVAGENQSRLVLSGLNEEKTHEIVCDVTNKAGMVTSRTAKLTVTMERTYLYNQGDENQDLTGGWGTVVVSKSDWSSTGVTATKYAAKMEAVCSGATGDTNNRAVFQTANKIDVTDYSVLSAEVSLSGYYSHAMLALTSTKYTSSNSVTPVSSGNTATKGNSTITKDVSALTGSYYVVVSLYRGPNMAGGGSMQCTQVMLK